MAVEGRRTWYLTDSSGTEIQLVDQQLEGYVLLEGMTGHLLPRVVIAADALPAGHGSVLRSIRLPERDIFLPVMLAGTSIVDVETMRRRLERLVDPLRGPVTLRVEHPSGERRRITGYYVGGGEGDAGSDGDYHEIKGLQLRCLDPWWYGDPATQPWRLTSSTKPFLSSTEPFFPVILTGSTVAGQASLVNVGDVDAPPIWDITGPGSSLTVTNQTTGEQWTYLTPIAAGQTIRVDTRPHMQSVTDAGSGVNLFTSLGPSPALWRLAPGANLVQVTMPGATSASVIAATWTPLYRTSG